MDINLEKQLVEKYPNLYRDYGGDITKTCMAWGFECGNGWFKLIDELSKKLESLNVIAMQVKEKFGGLRFYILQCDSKKYNEVHKYISEAENQSFLICESCGKPGKLRTGGWLQTLCDECFKK